MFRGLQQAAGLSEGKNVHFSRQVSGLNEVSIEFFDDNGKRLLMIKMYGVQGGLEPRIYVETPRYLEQREQTVALYRQGVSEFIEKHEEALRQYHQAVMRGQITPNTPLEQLLPNLRTLFSEETAREFQLIFGFDATQRMPLLIKVFRDGSYSFSLYSQPANIQDKPKVEVKTRVFGGKQVFVIDIAASKADERTPPADIGNYGMPTLYNSFRYDTDFNFVLSPEELTKLGERDPLRLINIFQGTLSQPINIPINRAQVCDHLSKLPDQFMVNVLTGLRRDNRSQQFQAECFFELYKRNSELAIRVLHKIDTHPYLPLRDKSQNIDLLLSKFNPQEKSVILEQAGLPETKPQ